CGARGQRDQVSGREASETESAGHEASETESAGREASETDPPCPPTLLQRWDRPAVVDRDRRHVDVLSPSHRPWAGAAPRLYPWEGTTFWLNRNTFSGS
ncbi:MAG: hypothetical protein ACOYBU_16290, partial [Dermatophilaceae bacterium]